MPYLRKVAIYILVLTLTSLTLYQFYLIFLVYVQGKTLMVDTFESQTDTDFPEITTCVKSRHKNVPAFDASFNISTSKTWKMEIASKEMFEMATFSKIQTIHKRFYARFFSADPTTLKAYWTYSTKRFGESESFFRKRSHPYFGQCATFLVSDLLSNLGLYYSYIKATYKEKFDIISFVHKSDNFWHTTLLSPGIITKYGEESQVQVNYEEVKQIPSETNDCSYVGRDTCFENYLRSKFSKGHGCLPPWFDLIGLPYCNGTKTIMEADDILQAAIDSFDKICKKPCHFLAISSGSRNHEKRPNSEIRAYLYFPYKVQHRVETFLLSPLKLVAEMGGYAGLLLGVSFFHVVYFINFVLDWCIDKVNTSGQ